uniref:SHSP domain-containing protein n=1 Tax=Picea sitchensis TaxID=3332 RepID=A9P1P3_PICSI|nr:unknown [Picea sitchensis]
MSIIPSFFGRSSRAFDPFSLEVWDPFQAFTGLAAGGPSGRFVKEASAVANTQIDWKETSEAHIFKADLPGLKKEEVKIELEEGQRILQISGERSKEEEHKNDKWHRIERSRGKFLRRFRLPENAKVEEMKASMENGVLTVTVPKQPEPQPPQYKSIEIYG